MKSKSTTPPIGSMLKRVIHAYIDQSRKISIQANADELRFNKEQIAIEAFPNQLHAKNRLSELMSGYRTPTHAQLRSILKACSSLIEEQCNHSYALSLRITSSEVERQICKTLGIKSETISPEDLHLPHLILTASSVEDLGCDDLSYWNPKRPWNDAHKAVGRSRAFSVLKNLEAVADCALSDEERLKFGRMAVSLANHFPLGHKNHDAIYDLSNHVLEKTHIYTLSDSRSVDPSTQLEALKIKIQQRWTRFAPLPGSKTNYLNSIIKQQPMSATVSSLIHAEMVEVLHLVQILVERSGSDEWARKKASSAHSLAARILLAMPGSSAQAEAKEHFQRAQPFIEQVYHPYTLQFDVLQKLVSGELREAETLCEQLIQVALAKNDHISECAFAAFLLQISAIGSGVPTSDKRITSLAKEAVKSNQIAFMYAHVFDAAEVKKLLKIIGSNGKRRNYE